MSPCPDPLAESARQIHAKKWLYPLTFGLLPLSCYLATGGKWSDISRNSAFIQNPGELIPEVSDFLKIDTDEQGSCRRAKGNRCVESDQVFSLSEQRNVVVESDARVHRIQVRAGHVEIVGDSQVAPRKLIAILQDQGAIAPTPPDRSAALEDLMSSIYEAASDFNAHASYR